MRAPRGPAIPALRGVAKMQQGEILVLDKSLDLAIIRTLSTAYKD
jgi:hypothetical protein